MRFFRFASPLLVAAALSFGCGPTPEEIANGDDPLRALESSAPSTKYGVAYWAEESQTSSNTWNDAVDKCGDPKWSATPNCTVVREQQAELESEGASGDQMPEEVAPDDTGEEVAPDEDAQGSDEEEPSGADDEEPEQPEQPGQDGAKEPGHGT